MKYIVLIIVLLVVGLLSLLYLPSYIVPAPTAKPTKELTLEEKVVGSYEAMSDSGTFKVVFFENGKFESYKNEKKKEATWRIVGNEIHIFEEGKSFTEVIKIEPNGDLTAIASIDKDGKREEEPKEYHIPLGKIK